ncbi:MAG: SiaB family protein kinase [Bacteroidetes bacterium]|nr:SiaB family protein kinase [Bacteroidota bacterium]
MTNPKNDPIHTIDALQYSLQLFDNMSKNNLQYVYRGRFTQKISDNIISIAQHTIDASLESPQVRKRIFTILVECLQNILRHQLTAETQELLSTAERSGILVLQKKDTVFQITSGNVIETALMPTLQQLLEKINSFNKKELKQLYLEVLGGCTVNDKGGAGLGLIDIARKSNTELSYKFQPIDDKYAFFYLHTTISYHNHSNQNVDFETIQDIHHIVNEQNIMLVYTGKLNQENLINLLSITNGLHYGEYDMKKKVFNIMVEMLQNIVKHGTKQHENDSGNPAIFYVLETVNAFMLNCGNYIENSVIEKLTGSIDYVNSLTGEQLNEYYIAQLLNFEIDTHKESGLGIIDLRIKSGNTIAYHIIPIDEKISFFTMQVMVAKVLH